MPVDTSRAPGASEQPGWRESLDALTGRSETSGGHEATGSGSREDGAPMGLQFEVREDLTRTSYRWNGPSTAPITAASELRGNARLCVRPVMRNSRGTWVKGALSWNRIGHQRGLDVDPAHQRWMVQFAALSRATRDVYYGQDTEWLRLDDFQSPLLWGVLADAARLGIRLVGPKKDAVVHVGHVAHLSLDAQLGDDLVLTPTLTIDGDEHDPARAGAVGDHGVYAWSLSPALVVALAPTPSTVTAEQRRLLGAGPAGGGNTRVTVPSDEVDAFMAEYYPLLRQRVTITSTDATVRFPEDLPPELVVTATFKPSHVLELGWAWDYRSHGVRIPVDGGDDTGDIADPGGEIRAGIRDRETEERLTALAADVLGGPPTAAVLTGMDAAEFAEHSLDRLDGIDGIRVEVSGDRPEYRELDAAPLLTIRTVETDEPDWFDLGVIVTIEGREIPLGPLFSALSRGRKKLLLTDGSYFSLQHPAFDRLRDLLDEASSLQEWEPGSLRISRSQVGLWSDFEDLADETEEAVGWRVTVEALRDVGRIEPPPLPSGLRATLRPYQLDGFAWLAFLHDHGLGGILADDMGLGKTLQTLALVAHATEQRSRRGEPGHPFLVVAPTSVVSNWAAEATRFVPGLRVATVDAARTTRRRPVREVAAGADVVVTSYTLFRLGAAEYRTIQWAGLILDEAQFVKNHASQAHTAARELRAPFTLAITGTPLENNLLELWSLFAIVAPGLFPSSRQFTERYVRPIEGTRRGIRNRGESPKPAGDPADVLARLHRRIRPLMMRRTKELVAAELPEKQEQVLRVELAPRHKRIYDMYLQRERQKLLGLLDDLDRNRFIVFRSLTLLRMLSLDASLVEPDEYAGVGSSKLDTLFEHLEDVIAEGHRALVFSQFTSFLSKAVERLESRGVPYAYLDGSTTRRGEMVERFRAGKAPVFLISLKAGGFGLNLTEADYVFLLDPWWNPASESQAIDRAHRIGQTKRVLVYRLVASDTIEEKVMALKAKKAKLFSQVMDDGSGAFSSALSADDIRGLLD